MFIIIVLTLLFLASIILAAYSMRDFNVPPEVKRVLGFKKIRGSIVFFKDRVTHYSSVSSRSSSSSES